jgi:uncharacterized protein (TIGR03000 family)
MYSVVLATMLMSGGEAPSWHHYSCSCSCSCACHGYPGYFYAGWGCHGCHGCHGCYGCYGCYGCSCSCSCSGCWGYTYYSSCSCYCSGPCSGWCSGFSSGGSVIVAVPPYYGCSCSCACSGYAPVYAAPAQASKGPETLNTAPTKSGMPPLEGSVTPRTKAEREAVKRLLDELRNKKQEEEEVSTESPALETTASARVTARLPIDARLWVDQVECPLTSGERTFNTPPLAPGQTYYYTLKMQVQRQGVPMTDSQRVLVNAGRSVTVTFPNPDPITTASR